jgi:hypothetical protein
MQRKKMRGMSWALGLKKSEKGIKDSLDLPLLM